MAKDWAAGRYPANLLQKELIPRLLMYGESYEQKGYVPHGNVEGFNSRLSTGTIEKITVGLDGMHRQPNHPDPDSQL